MTETDALQNLHYFYSTAPQVLGAILAITGAFVVLKLTDLKKALISHSQKLLDYKISFTGFEAYTFYDNIIKNKNLMNDEKEVIHNYYQLILGRSYLKIKYAQMGGKYEDLKQVIEKIIITDFGFEFSGRINEMEAELILDRDNFITKYEDYKEFITNTQSTYLINGLLLGVLIFAFLFIPYIAHGAGYWIALIFGIAITITSISLILDYLITSFTIGLQKESE